MTERETQPPQPDRPTKIARVLDLTEASLWIGLIIVGVMVSLAVMRDSESRHRPRANAKPAPTGLIEAEDLEVIEKSRDFTFWLQPSSGFRGGNWSKDGHMFAHGVTNGDWIDFRLPQNEPGRYSLEIFMTKAADYGIVAVSVDGVQLETFDLWSGRGIVPTGPLKLGEVELGNRENVMRVAIAGKNPNATAPFFQFGIDGIRIERLAPDPGDSERGAADSSAAEPRAVRRGSDGDRAQNARE